MGTIGVIIFYLVMWGLAKLAAAIRESNFDNYTPPHGQRIDHGQMNDDLRRGVSIDSVKEKTVQGKYNIPDDICK